MAGSRLTWNGQDIAAKAKKAAEMGIDETMAEAVVHAQIAAPRDTGAMANGIKIIERARTDGNVSHGFWGNVTQDYTLWQEIGSRGRAGRYFLRRAADAEYPKLAARIRARMDL